MPAFFFVSGLLASNSVLKKKWSDVFTKKNLKLIIPVYTLGFFAVAVYKKNNYRTNGGAIIKC